MSELSRSDFAEGNRANSERPPLLQLLLSQVSKSSHALATMQAERCSTTIRPVILVHNAQEE